VSSFGKSSARSGSRRGSKSLRGDSRGGGLGKLEDEDQPLILELEDDEDEISKFDDSRKLFKMLQKAVRGT
jgi:hypothetical protein